MLFKFSKNTKAKLFFNNQQKKNSSCIESINAIIFYIIFYSITFFYTLFFELQIRTSNQLYRYWLQYCETLMFKIYTQIIIKNIEYVI